MLETSHTAEARDRESLNILLWLAALGFFMQTVDSTIFAQPAPATDRGSERAKSAGAARKSLD